MRPVSANRGKDRRDRPTACACPPTRRPVLPDAARRDQPNPQPLRLTTDTPADRSRRTRDHRSPRVATDWLSTWPRGRGRRVVVALERSVPLFVQHIRKRRGWQYPDIAGRSGPRGVCDHRPLNERVSAAVEQGRQPRNAGVAAADAHPACPCVGIGRCRSARAEAEQPVSAPAWLDAPPAPLDLDGPRQDFRPFDLAGGPEQPMLSQIAERLREDPGGPAVDDGTRRLTAC